jgi:Tfp pilus assembly pilus retraction ATPase PilT
MGEPSKLDELVRFAIKIGARGLQLKAGQEPMAVIAPGRLSPINHPPLSQEAITAMGAEAAARGSSRYGPVEARFTCSSETIAVVISRPA